MQHNNVEITNTYAYSVQQAMAFPVAFDFQLTYLLPDVHPHADGLERLDAIFLLSLTPLLCTLLQRLCRPNFLSPMLACGHSIAEVTIAATIGMPLQ